MKVCLNVFGLQHVLNAAVSMVTDFLKAPSVLNNSNCDLSSFAQSEVKELETVNEKKNLHSRQIDRQEVLTYQNQTRHSIPDWTSIVDLFVVVGCEHDMT